ncbi:MAG: hypothetical protein R2860_10025 [Desulfobacterales bacterium]
MDIVVTFLAILEIVKLKLVRLVVNGRSNGMRLFIREAGEVEGRRLKAKS